MEIKIYVCVRFRTRILLDVIFSPSITEVMGIWFCQHYPFMAVTDVLETRVDERFQKLIHFEQC